MLGFRKLTQLSLLFLNHLVQFIHQVFQFGDVGFEIDNPAFEVEIVHGRVTLDFAFPASICVSSEYNGINIVVHSRNADRNSFERMLRVRDLLGSDW